jgi:hypothetical protein
MQPNMKSYAIVFTSQADDQYSAGRFATVAAAAAIAHTRSRRLANVRNWRVVETEDPVNIGRFHCFWITYDCSLLCWLAAGLAVVIFLLWRAWQARLIVTVIFGILAAACAIATASRKGEDFQGGRGIFAFGAVTFLVLAAFLLGVSSGRHEQWSYQVGCDNGDRYDCLHLVP